MRLYKEFDVINDRENSEKWLLNSRQENDYYNPYFPQFSQMYFKYGMFLRAEYYL